MHIDNLPLLKMIANRLKICKVRTWGKYAYFTVKSLDEIKVIIDIFDRFPLNTSKH